MWAAAGAGGLSLGALLGGVLTEAVGWRGVFFVNVPLTLAGIVGAVVLLARDVPPRERARGFDLPGALTGTTGLSLLVFAAAQGSDRGWTSWPVLPALLAAITLLAAFVAIESAARRPAPPAAALRQRKPRRGLGGGAGALAAVGAALTLPSGARCSGHGLGEQPQCQ